MLDWMWLFNSNYYDQFAKHCAFLIRFKVYLFDRLDKCVHRFHYYYANFTWQSRTKLPGNRRIILMIIVIFQSDESVRITNEANCEKLKKLKLPRDSKMSKKKIVRIEFETLRINVKRNTWNLAQICVYVLSLLFFFFFPDHGTLFDIPNERIRLLNWWKKILINESIYEIHTTAGYFK